jgi:hypothetical protein
MKNIFAIILIITFFSYNLMGQKTIPFNNEKYIKEQADKYNLHEWLYDKNGELIMPLLAIVSKDVVDEKIELYKKRNRVKQLRESIQNGITFKQLIHSINTEFKDIKDWVGFTPEWEKVYTENENKFLIIIPQNYKGAYVITHNIDTQVNNYGIDAIKNKQALKYTQKEVPIK